MQLVWLIPSLAMGIFFGLTSGLWQMAVMSGLSALIAILIRFRGGKAKPFKLKISQRGVFINGKRAPRLMCLWRREWREEYARQFEQLVAGLQQELSKTSFEPLSFVAGFNLELDLGSLGPHLFLVGPTGSGKSKWLQLVLSSMSGEPRLLLADYKGGVTLSPFGEPISDLSPKEHRDSFWLSLAELLEERERYLVVHGVARACETSLKPVLVVVDELAHALREDRGALAALSAVAARGRSLGVHLICASQSVSGVPRELLVNLNLRVILAGVDEVDALQLGAKTRPQRVAGVGVGQVIGGPEFRFPFRQVPIQAQQHSNREQPQPVR